MPADDIEPIGEDSAARPAGEAKGGIAPQPGDPTSPKEARQRARASNEAMRNAGFGDDKGGVY